MICCKNLFLTALTLTTLTIAQPAESANAPESGKDVQMCIAEVAKRADYTDATRIVHLVHVSQKNLAEKEFRIDTTVYAGGDGAVARSYNSSCITLGKIRMVDFRMHDAKG